MEPIKQDNMGRKLNPRTHVLLPHMIQSYVASRKRKKIHRWELIKKALLQLKRTCDKNVEFDFGREIRKRVKTYNVELNGDFGVLEKMISLAYESWGKVEVCRIVSFMVDSCLEVEKFTGHIQLLTGEAPGEEVVELSKREIVCLLANAFFCCYHERSREKGDNSEFPKINFDRLFDDSDQTRGRNSGGWRSQMKQSKVHKLLCVFNYFRRMKDVMGGGGEGDQCSLPIIFKRITLASDDTPSWGPDLEHRFCSLIVRDSGSVDDGLGDGLVVDFANKMVGGGTLGNGAVMEEILFSCCPELISSMLFTRELRDNECLIVNGGFEKFSKGKGYAGSFRFDGDYYSQEKEEDTGRRRNRTVALDAFRFKKNSLQTQLEKHWIDRELTKCFVGFRGEQSKVCTGKWGCGIFNGEKYLKCIIQFIACSVARVPYLEMYTFGDAELENALQTLDTVVKTGDIKVGKVYKFLVDFGQSCTKEKEMTGKNMFDQLIDKLSEDDERDQTGDKLSNYLLDSSRYSILWKVILFLVCCVGLFLLWWLVS